jgi:triphosphoribosyl-dephospho-CoA synthase
VIGLSQHVAGAFKAACRDELQAPKPGNVHVFAGGHRMTAADFERSADAAAAPLATSGASVGARISGAVEATWRAVGANTNLGIILLCAPLAKAAESTTNDLRRALSEVMARLDVGDTALAFPAIAQASPAGLGRVERHDVHAPPTASLRDAMAEAADRDRVAYQYVTDFVDVFELGLPLLERMRLRGAEPHWATLAVYLEFLCAFPDTHIARKYGMTAARDVSAAALTFRDAVANAHAPESLLPALLGWDSELKARNINPGTSADLTVATLFAHRLRNVLPSSHNND